MKYIVKTTSPLNSCEWINSPSKKALVLMSGGVDSSAAALLLMKENYTLAGMTMEIAPTWIIFCWTLCLFSVQRIEHSPTFQST